MKVSAGNFSHFKEIKDATSLINFLIALFLAPLTVKPPSSLKITLFSGIIQ
jgi:hypothetical protein